MKEIELSKQGPNRGNYVALVDDDDYDYINRFTWCASQPRNVRYAARGISNEGKYTTQYMHVLILGGKSIDHIDGNGLNNQKSNLRFCTHSENQMNVEKRKNTTSVYKGVSFYKRDIKWGVAIKINGKTIHLGSFSSETDAAKAYNIKAAELFGKFANLNIINE